MTKPNPKDVVVNVVNTVIRGYIHIDKIRMILAERQYDRKKRAAAMQNLHDNVLDLQAAMNARKLIQDRCDAGMYRGYDETTIHADYLMELAFAKIAIRNEK